jgi:hypothetical protein
MQANNLNFAFIIYYTNAGIVGTNVGIGHYFVVNLQ